MDNVPGMSWNYFRSLGVMAQSVHITTRTSVPPFLYLFMFLFSDVAITCDFYIYQFFPSSLSSSWALLLAWSRHWLDFPISVEQTMQGFFLS